MGLDWIGVIVGAVLAVPLIAIAAHVRARGARLAWVGFALSLFFVPVLFGQLLQSRQDKAAAEQTSSASEARLIAAIAANRRALDVALLAIVQVAADRSLTPTERRARLTAALTDYNRASAAIDRLAGLPAAAPLDIAAALNTRAPATAAVRPTLVNPPAGAPAAPSATNSSTPPTTTSESSTPPPPPATPVLTPPPPAVTVPPPPPPPPM